MHEDLTGLRWSKKFQKKFFPYVFDFLLFL
jgi:hypothetical protein